MQGCCIADIGCCGIGFDFTSSSVQTEGSELADRTGEINKAKLRAP